MKITTSLALVSALAASSSAAPATFTLYAVQTTTGLARPSETFSPIGVAANGATSYYNEIVASVYYEQQLNGGGTTFTSGGSVITQPAAIRTFTSDPITFQATIVQDASHFVFHKEPAPTGDIDVFGNHLSCDLDGRGGGACVNERWIKGEPTATSTYTGSAVPYYTVVVEPESDSKGGSGNGNGNGGKDNAATRAGAGCGVLVLAVMLGALQVL